MHTNLECGICVAVVIVHVHNEAPYHGQRPVNEERVMAVMSLTFRMPCRSRAPSWQVFRPVR